MNVQGSKDLGQVARLMAVGEIGAYEKLVAEAGAAAAGLAGLRAAANVQWGQLIDLCETAAGRTGRTYGGIKSFVYEIAAGEFVNLANFGIDDSYDLAPAGATERAALYITEKLGEYERLAATARIVYKRLYAAGNRALISAAGYAPADAKIAAAYEELAARVAAEIGEYTYGATSPESVRAELARY